MTSPEPAHAYDATGTARCPGGQIVTCNAPVCDCIDGIGCNAYDANFNRDASKSQACPTPTPAPPTKRPGEGGDIVPVLD